MSTRSCIAIERPGKKIAKEVFEEKYPGYKVVENKIIPPSKKLINQYKGGSIKRK